MCVCLDSASAQLSLRVFREDSNFCVLCVTVCMCVCLESAADQLNAYIVHNTMQIIYGIKQSAQCVFSAYHTFCVVCVCLDRASAQLNAYIVHNMHANHLWN